MGIFNKRSKDRIKGRMKSESFRQAGKGSNPRTNSTNEKFRKNFDDTFNKCSTHPRYRGKCKPRANCAVCRRLWREWELMLSPRPE